ncbi:MAG: hypothetical protein HW421_2430 [Ignavibacteria bacterium]|nr:hypothetical protein [Ignavibacteria bacterium]
MKKAYKTMTDEELYRAMADDNAYGRHCFDEIYLRHSSKVYTYCKKVLGDSDLADDLFQETFIKFFNSSKSGREMTNVGAFIFKIARNLCLNEKQRKHHTFVPLDELNMPYYDDLSDSKEREQFLQTALDALPRKYREMLILKEYLGLTYNEIADMLETTMATVRIRIYRAKTKLRELLVPYLEQ